MKRGLVIPVLVTLLFMAWAGTTGANEIQLDVKERTLANGMTILVLEKHTAPVFTGLIRFKTGSIDEHPGITGISHFLEHMMFKGTRIFGTNNYEAEVPLMRKIDSLGDLMLREQIKLQNPIDAPDSTRYRELRQQIADIQAEGKPYVVKDELWSTYLQHGGTRLNAGTGNDGTSYFVSLPKNKLELWALLESDRLKNIVFREFYSERDVVMEERRLSLENEPDGRLDEAFSATMFWANPYGWPVVGWMTDLQRITHEDLKEYFRIHYGPGNAVAVIVGDVNAEEVFSMCEKYFGDIPAQPLPPAVMTVDDNQMGERRVEVVMDANPKAFVGWHIPRIGHPDIAPLDVAANILASGRTSRFYKKIK
ncbi:MAG: pitrilysin family protein [Candidatus Zixiibacteriota bacterium]